MIKNSHVDNQFPSNIDKKEIDICQNKIFIP